jgi:excisionase family DNA binding protein
MESPGDLLLLEEVAKFARVSTDTVRFWIRSGKLPSVRPGRRRMVARGVLERFLSQDCTKGRARS